MKKRFMSLVLATMMVFSLVSTSAFALGVEDTVDNTFVLSNDAYEIHQMFDLSSLQNTAPDVSIPENAHFTDTGITESIAEPQPMALVDDVNTPPVAALQVVILNPESMVNGNFTTETQLAWLWAYNGESFTYDPDGDDIVDMRIGGIFSDDIIGTLNGGIGFATQFNTAAQYILTFQVQDSRGAWSNVAQYAFQIEPADGNTRPVCEIGISSNKVAVNQLMMVSWADSSDSDAGDSVTGCGGVVIKDGVMSNLADYAVQVGQDYCVLTFTESETYEIRMRVCDSHDAWSDWVTFNVQVEDVRLTNVVIEGITDLEGSQSYWVRQNEAKNCQVENSHDGAAFLCENFGSHSFPYSLPRKLVMDTNFFVWGQVVTESGIPVPNTTVTIRMPVYGSTGIRQTVTTDSKGYFTYNPSSHQYWVDIGYYKSTNDVDLLHSGTMNAEYIRYSSSTGTTFVYPTSVSVSALGTTYSEDVICEIGYSQDPVIGSLVYIRGEWYYI